MYYSLFYFNDAEIDFNKAKSWYKLQKDGLDQRFSDSVESVTSTIQQNPFAFAVQYKNIRIAQTKIFPYGIHYYVDEANYQIVIVAIIHSKRNNRFFP